MLSVGGALSQYSCVSSGLSSYPACEILGLRLCVMVEHANFWPHHGNTVPRPHNSSASFHHESLDILLAQFRKDLLNPLGVPKMVGHMTSLFTLLTIPLQCKVTLVRELSKQNIKQI